MNQIFDWLRKKMQERIRLYQTLDTTENTVDVAIKETERFIEYINEAEAKLRESEKFKESISKCNTCSHYIGNIVPPICYFCCKGIEDNYVAKEETN